MAGAYDFILRDPIYGSGTKTAYTGTAGSTTVPASSQSVLVWCSTIAYVRIGGTATTADLAVPANVFTTIPIALNQRTGAPIVVSAVQDASGGNLYCLGLAE